jgi:acylphosphatase
MAPGADGKGRLQPGSGRAGKQGPQASARLPWFARIVAVASDDLIRRRVVVHGRVQGVFFRDSAQARAEAEGVSGWIANRDDGTVEAALEGPPDAVERMVAFCLSGPERARVEQVKQSDEEPEGIRGFTVR